MTGNTGAARHASPLSSDLRGEICFELRQDAAWSCEESRRDRDGAVSSELACLGSQTMGFPWFSELVLAEFKGQLHNRKILAKHFTKALIFSENVQQRWRWEGIVQLARLPDRIHLLCWMRSNADPLWGWQGIKGSQEGGNYDGTPSTLVWAAMKEAKKGNNEDTICWQCLAARLVCSVDCWTLKSKMNNTFHSNNEKTNSARHNISCFFQKSCWYLVFILFFGHCAEHGKSWACHSGDNNWRVLGKTKQAAKELQEAMDSGDEAVDSGDVNWAATN